jgi:predicted metal-dependent enzyme (double-stranded beta helix superfamily)
LPGCLATPDWLPATYRAAAPESGMGSGIGQWLLCRADDGSQSLFSLVVPPGSQTPIHDHLAWGLVGLYRGTQDEEICILESSNGAPPRPDPALARRSQWTRAGSAAAKAGGPHGAAAQGVDELVAAV